MKNSRIRNVCFAFSCLFAFGLAPAAQSAVVTFQWSCNGEIQRYPASEGYALDYWFSPETLDPSFAGKTLRIDKVHVTVPGINLGSVVNWDLQVLIDGKDMALPEGQFTKTRTDPVSGYNFNMPTQYHITFGDCVDSNSYVFEATHDFVANTTTASPYYSGHSQVRSDIFANDGLHAQLFFWTGDTRLNPGILFNGTAKLEVTLEVISPITSSWAVDASGNWSSNANWSEIVPNGVDCTATFGNISTASRTVNLDTDVTLGTINFNQANYSLTIAGTKKLALRASSGNAAVNVTNGVHWIKAPLVLQNNMNVMVAKAQDGLAITSTISEAGGAKGLSKSGNGTLALLGVQTYTGPTIVNAGTLAVINGALSASSLVTVNSGATLAGNGTVGNVTVNNGGHVAPSSELGLRIASLSLGSGSVIDARFNQLGPQYYVPN